MKKLSILILLAIASISTIQAQDYLQTITENTCNCIKNQKLADNKETMHMQLGICVIEQAEPFKKQLKKDHKIDFDNIYGEDGKKLGQLIGIKMASVCPEELLRITRAGKEKEEEAVVEEIAIDTVSYYEELSGKIVSISGEQFYNIKIETNERKQYSLLWLYHFENSVDLLKDPKVVIGKNIHVEYSKEEFFDPKTKEYREYKVIRSLSFQ